MDIFSHFDEFVVFGSLSTLNDICSFLMTATVSLFHGSYVQVREFQIRNQSVFNVCIMHNMHFPL